MTIRKIIAEALSLPLERITPQAAMEVLTEWDSIGHLNILAALEQHFGKEVPFDLITELTDVRSLQRYFGTK